MQSASQRNIMISYRKLRRSANVVRGLPVEKAFTALSLASDKGSKILLKKLIEVVANYRQKSDDLTGVYVSSIEVDEGPVLKRFKPRAQGRIYKRMKRSSHLKITLDQKVS